MRLFHLLRLFLVVEFSSGKLLSEDLGEVVRQGAEVEPAMEQRVFAHESANRDMVSINMFKVYEKYSKEPQSQRDGNTVRSFKAVPSEWPHEPVWAVLSGWTNLTDPVRVLQYLLLMLCMQGLLL